MSLQRINLNSSSGQGFSTVVNGVLVSFVFRYNLTIERFYFSISVDDELVLSGRTLEKNIDLLSVFKRIFSIGSLFCTAVDNSDKEPTLENIGNGSVRVYLNVTDS